MLKEQVRKDGQVHGKKEDNFLIFLLMVYWGAHSHFKSYDKAATYSMNDTVKQKKAEGHT